MKIINIDSPATRALAILVGAIAVVVALLASVGSDVAAYQPHGLSISEIEIPDPPCPYGHDDGCENANPSTLGRLHQPSNPHAQLPHVGAGVHPMEQLASIARTNRRLVGVNIQTSGDLTGQGNGADALAGVGYAIVSEINNLPWVADGLTSAERLTRDWLGELHDHNPALAIALTKMPFMQDHTPGDLQAIQTLTLISDFYDDPAYATAIVNSDGFADGGGMDNTEAKIVAVMSMPYGEGRAGLIGLLTDLGTVEEKRVTGRNGQTISFAVVRVLHEAENSKLMQAATSATKDAETLMAQPLPTDFVGVLVASAPAAGANNQISIWMDSTFDTSSVSDRHRQRVVGHEIGHYWWAVPGAGTDWLSEGAASYVGAYTVWSQFDDNDLYVDTYPCAYYRTIEHLRADNPQDGSWGSLCNYSLGERMFINLDRSMTTTEFNAAFRDLHRRVSTYPQNGVDLGLSLVRAFCSQCLTSTRNLGGTGFTLARHYGEKVLTDTSAPTGAIAGLGQVVSTAVIGPESQNRQYRVAQVPASSSDQRRWVQVIFENPTTAPTTVRVVVEQYHENRNSWYGYYQVRPVFTADKIAWFNVYLGDPYRRATGHHWVYIYNESFQKIAEAEYQVLP